jgi:hypothetical protein
MLVHQVWADPDGDCHRASNGNIALPFTGCPPRRRRFQVGDLSLVFAASQTVSKCITRNDAALPQGHELLRFIPSSTVASMIQSIAHGDWNARIHTDLNREAIGVIPQVQLHQRGRNIFRRQIGQAPYSSMPFRQSGDL